MLKTGAEHLASLRDGRVVYIGGEKVDDVTTHPAFRNAARSMAARPTTVPRPGTRGFFSTKSLNSSENPDVHAAIR